MDEHYHHTDLVDVYDILNASRSDFDFYANALPDTPASIVDVGCGTGTFALDLANRGYDVTGVDPAPQMIAIAERKDTERQVVWKTGYVSDLPKEQRFDVAVMTGHAFQCLLTDEQINLLFEAVRARLGPNGSFWFETRNPLHQAWLRWTPEHAKTVFEPNTGKSVRVVQELMDVKDGFVTFEERYEFTDRVLRSQSTLRFLEVDEIERLASRNGLALAEVFGGWSKEAFTENSPEIIVRLVHR